MLKGLHLYLLKDELLSTYLNLANGETNNFDSHKKWMKLKEDEAVTLHCICK